MKGRDVFLTNRLIYFIPLEIDRSFAEFGSIFCLYLSLTLTLTFLLPFNFYIDDGLGRNIFEKIG